MDDGAMDLRLQLERIAAMLGCSVETFLGPPEIDPLAGTAELLRLWCAIPGDAGRLRVLTCAREAVGDVASPRER